MILAFLELTENYNSIITLTDTLVLACCHDNENVIKLAKVLIAKGVRFSFALRFFSTMIAMSDE